jgi:hypothetical protein
MVGMIRRALPQDYIDALVRSYGYHVGDVSPEGNLKLQRSGDLASYLHDAWNLRGSGQNLSQQVRCMNFGEESLLSIFILVAFEEVRERQLTRRLDIPEDYNVLTNYALAERLRISCSRG